MKFWDDLYTKNNRTSLEEVKRIINDLNIDIDFKIINVVGTNGKGSISNFLYQGLTNAGFKTGLFTSPHIYKPNERVIVNGKMITDSEVESILKSLPSDLHFFAYMFLMAIVHFANEGCDIVVMEAGIGGLRDTTKSLDGDYGLVTSIGLDHTEYLGNTTEAIANDKSGIINKGMDFLVPSFINEKDIFISKGAKEIQINGTSYKDRNKMLAQKALKKWFSIEFSNFKEPIGRTQIFKNNDLTTVFDVAHNIDGIKESMKLIPNEIEQVVFSFKKTKDTEDILELFKGYKCYYFKPNSMFKDFVNIDEIQDINDFYKKQDKATLYIGSFQLIGSIKTTK